LYLSFEITTGQRSKNGVVAKVMSSNRLDPYERFVLCRPHGGLNDTLVQIFRCYAYAKEHQRNLIIDTLRSGIYLPFDRFFKLNTPDPSVFMSLNSDILHHLQSLACHPVELQGRIDSYTLVLSPKIKGYRDSQSEAPTKLDFSESFDEPLVIHEAYGGGKQSIDMLRLLRFTTSVADEVKLRLSDLPDAYAVLQIRNTDMKTDYLPFLEALKHKITGKFVVVCSDDDAAVTQVRAALGFANTASLRRIGGFKGRPLHMLGKHLNENLKFDIMMDALTDLMAMALSEKLYFTENRQGTHSGFAQLGRLLHSDNACALQLLHR
jgi:hypothetical protein